MFKKIVSRRRRSFALAPAAFVALVLTACHESVDLDAVKQYAQTTAAARDSFAAIAADFGESCKRRAELKSNPPTLARRPVSLAPGFDGTPAAATSDEKPLPAVFAFDDACKDYAGISDAWGKHNEVVIGYVRALGGLAGVDLSVSFAPLGDALAKNSLISDTQNTAFSKLAAEITAALLENRRKDAIARLVKASDADLRTSVGALKDVDRAYATVLGGEFDATYELYRKVLLDEQPTPANRLLILEQRAELSARLDRINRLRAATISYASTLDDIVATHEKIKQSGERTGLADLAAIAKDILGRFGDDVSALRKATK